MPQKRILIVGAGIAGLALARLLREAKIPYLLIEKRSELSSDGAGIALPANAVRALRHMGLGEAIDQAAHQVHTIFYTDSAGSLLAEGSLLETPLNADHFVALHRHRFQDILSKDLEESIRFNASISDIQESEEGILVSINEEPLEEFAALVGADGINSAVRKHIFPEIEIEDLGVDIWRWTTTYNTKNLEPTYMLGFGELFMAYPIGPNEVYCYAHKVAAKTARIADPQSELRSIFAHYGGSAQALLNQLPANSEIIPGRLRSVAKPVLSKGRVALVGDASHACSPMLQQGAALALEDVISLAAILKAIPNPIAAFANYAEYRKERVNWIVQNSDGPMKKVISLSGRNCLGLNFITDPLLYYSLKSRIRLYGPPNVLGWRQLLREEPITELAGFIKLIEHKEPQEGLVYKRPS